ncbi:MAG: hypothetical protein M1371_03970 [Actinobacteria bacterium]|nr:hypothetical protein [Actinomycetota bacterium]
MTKKIFPLIVTCVLLFSLTMGLFPTSAYSAPTKTVTVPVQLAAQSITIQVVSLTSPIYRGYKATLKIKTTPGAYCTITVYYKSGPSTAKGLNPKNADGNGYVSWTWKVGSNTTPGTWSIVVKANANGQTKSMTIPFTVLKK